MVALRKPPDLPVKKILGWQEGFAQVAAGFARTLGLGPKEEQGYYAKHRCGVLGVQKTVIFLTYSGGSMLNKWRYKG